ncbi:hypothetical protein ACQR35_02860 [Pseudarthrobacter sp. J1738]|uniref:hypothetical protein n=1 Tax=Pseudarthrobacter sp. J1738 TaxID=3420446 RepID=UPI003D2685FC
MQQNGGAAWKITMDTSPAMMTALYVRDAAGLVGAGEPAISKASPRVHPMDHHHLTAPVGGQEALRIEWENWWRALVKNPHTIDFAVDPGLDPEAFGQFENSPALQRVFQAHYGAALEWVQKRSLEYKKLQSERYVSGVSGILQDMVQDRELELGRSPRNFELSIIELPLCEERAWYLEPDTIIMSHNLLSQPEIFRSYVQPVVELLV